MSSRPTSSRNAAIAIAGLSKAYRITTTTDRPTLITEAVLDAARRGFRRPRKETFYALRDIELSVQPGEAVGVIGRNGAGKSTLLKILSRVTTPTAGRIELRGRLGSLLEVGTGFHPELTGRENVFLNGAILGMRRSEIARAFDSIIDFAQIERFLDTPVKRYSSGMYVRLAFAVAAHLRTEILVVDEVLAVGDTQFQKKCIGKMGEVSSEEGRTVLFVSHQMVSVAAFCSRSVYLEEGRVAFDGPTSEAVERYLAGANEVIEESRGVFDLEHAARGTDVQQPMLRHIELRDGGGQLTDTIPMGGDLTLAVDIDGLMIPRHYLVLTITTDTDVKALYFTTLMRPPEIYDPDARQDRLVITFPNLPLTPGRYYVQIVVSEGGMAMKSMLDRVERAASFEIVAADVFGSGYQLGSSANKSACFVVPYWEVHGDGVVTAATAKAIAMAPADHRVDDVAVAAMTRRAPVAAHAATDPGRRLLDHLKEKFGTLGEADAQAIVDAVARMNGHHVDPRVWQQESAHDLLDLIGVPRAVVLAPYSLRDRLLVLQRQTRRDEGVGHVLERHSPSGPPLDDDRPLTGPSSGNGGVPAPTQADTTSSVGVDSAAVDLGDNLPPTRDAVQAELVALRELVESFSTEMKQRLEAVQAELLLAAPVPGPEPEPEAPMPIAAEATGSMSREEAETDAGPALDEALELEPASGRRSGWLVLLLLLNLVGVALTVVALNFVYRLV